MLWAPEVPEELSEEEDAQFRAGLAAHGEELAEELRAAGLGLEVWEHAWRRVWSQAEQATEKMRAHIAAMSNAELLLWSHRADLDENDIQDTLPQLERRKDALIKRPEHERCEVVDGVIVDVRALDDAVRRLQRKLRKVRKTALNQYEGREK